MPFWGGGWSNPHWEPKRPFRFVVPFPIVVPDSDQTETSIATLAKNARFPWNKYQGQTFDYPCVRCTKPGFTADLLRGTNVVGGYQSYLKDAPASYEFSRVTVELVDTYDFDLEATLTAYLYGGGELPLRDGGDQAAPYIATPRPIQISNISYDSSDFEIIELLDVTARHGPNISRDEDGISQINIPNAQGVTSQGRPEQELFRARKFILKNAFIVGASFGEYSQDTNAFSKVSVEIAYDIFDYEWILYRPDPQWTQKRVEKRYQDAYIAVNPDSLSRAELNALQGEWAKKDFLAAEKEIREAHEQACRTDPSSDGCIEHNPKLRDPNTGTEPVDPYDSSQSYAERLVQLAREGKTREQAEEIIAGEVAQRQEIEDIELAQARAEAGTPAELEAADALQNVAARFHAGEPLSPEDEALVATAGPEAFQSALGSAADEAAAAVEAAADAAAIAPFEFGAYDESAAVVEAARIAAEDAAAIAPGGDDLQIDPDLDPDQAAETKHWAEQVGLIAPDIPAEEQSVEDVPDPDVAAQLEEGTQDAPDSLPGEEAVDESPTDETAPYEPAPEQIETSLPSEEAVDERPYELADPESETFPTEPAAAAEPEPAETGAPDHHGGVPVDPAPEDEEPVAEPEPAPEPEPAADPSLAETDLDFEGLPRQGLGDRGPGSEGFGTSESEETIAAEPSPEEIAAQEGYDAADVDPEEEDEPAAEHPVRGGFEEEPVLHPLDTPYTLQVEEEGEEEGEVITAEIVGPTYDPDEETLTGMVQEPGPGEGYFLPLDNFVVNDHFGQRTDPITGVEGSMHYGTDIRAQTGTIARAVFSGEVTHSYYSNSYGNTIVVTLDDGYEVLYAHLSERSVDVGDRVIAGQQIGLTGATGYRVTGPHLHFEVRQPGDYSTFAIRDYPGDVSVRGEIDPCTYFAQVGLPCG